MWLFGYKELITSLRLALNTNDFSANAMNINGFVNEIIDIHAWRAAMDSLQHNGDEQAALMTYTEVKKMLYISSGGLSTLRYILSKLFFWGSFFYLLWRHIRLPADAKRLLFYSTAAYVFYFIFNTGVHENHLHMALLLASVLVVFDRQFFSLLAWLVALYNLNIIYFYGITGSWPENFIATTDDPLTRPLILLDLLVITALLLQVFRHIQRDHLLIQHEVNMKKTYHNLSFTE
ncbi:MAG: hypothetical protein R3E63_06410 [Pseudomonadales bacterium]